MKPLPYFLVSTGADASAVHYAEKVEDIEALLPWSAKANGG